MRILLFPARQKNVNETQADTLWDIPYLHHKDLLGNLKIVGHLLDTEFLLKKLGFHDCKLSGDVADNLGCRPTKDSIGTKCPPEAL